MLTGFKAATEFCDELKSRNIRYFVKVDGEEFRGYFVMVMFLTPWTYWEVEFFEDGSIEIEKYVSEGMTDFSDPKVILREFWDD